MINITTTAGRLQNAKSKNIDRILFLNSFLGILRS